MNEKKEKRLRLLVVIDGSPVSEKAVLVTSQFAGKAEVHVDLLHVLEDVIHYDEIPKTYRYDLRKEQAQKILDKAKSIANAIGLNDVDTKIAVGPVEDEINRVAGEKGYAGIVLGVRETGLFKKLLSTAPRPLVLVK